MKTTKICQMCGIKIKSLSPMRKWCHDCRKKLMVIRQREKKQRLRAEQKQ